MTLPIRGDHAVSQGIPSAVLLGSHNLPVSRGVPWVKRRDAVPARRRRHMPCADAVLVLHDRLPTRPVYL